MKNIVVSAIAAAVLVSLAGTASAQALKPEEMIKIRKSGYSFMAWNMGKIKANVDGEFNKEQVVAAANLVAATANSGAQQSVFESLFLVNWVSTVFWNRALASARSSSPTSPS